MAKSERRETGALFLSDFVWLSESFITLAQSKIRGLALFHSKQWLVAFQSQAELNLDSTAF
jgi:hypothetical protein